MCKQVTTTYHVPPHGFLINVRLKATTKIKVKYYIRGIIQNKLDKNQWNIKYEDITNRTVDNEPWHIKYGDITHRTVDNEPCHIKY